MRIRPLTRREIERIRQRNVRDRQRYEEWREERRRRSFVPKIPHGPMLACNTCGTLTKQRTVYAKLPLSRGKQGWEEVFTLCLKCLKEGRDPLIHVTKQVYSLLPKAEGTVQEGVAALVVSTLKDGPLPLSRVVYGLRKAGVSALEFDLTEGILKPMVEAGLISSEKVDYTQRVMEKVLASRMRLKVCAKEKSRSLLPIYIQFREPKPAMRVRMKRLGFFCLGCHSFALDDEQRVRRLLKMGEGEVAYAFSYDSPAIDRRRRRKRIVLELPVL